MADAADLARTMLDLQRARLTAVLAVQGHGVRTVVYFREGAPVWAGEGAVDRTLGRQMLRDGTLDAEQYGTVIERMSEALARGEEARFGEVAVQLGFIDRRQVHEALREQAGRKIMDCLAVEDCDIEVNESAQEVAAVPQHVLRLEPLIAAGVRLHWDDGRTGPLVAALADQKPTLRAEAGVLAQRLGLGLADVAMLATVDGARTTRAIVEGSPLGAEQGARLFAALVVLDALAFQSRPSRPTTGSGVLRSARPAPPAPPAPARPAPPAPARPVVAASPAPVPAAADAALTADDPPRFSQLPPDVRRVRLEAEQLFLAGRAQLEAGKTFPAARKLRRAAALYPEAAEYGLWAEWAEYKTERDPEELSKRQLRLTDAAVAALRQDKQLPMGHFVLGLMLAQSGERDTAIRFLRRAVELDPKNREAERKLRSLLAGE